MPHIENEGYVPPLEKAHRLMREGRTESKWCDATGNVDIVLELLDMAEAEGEEWGKPVHDPEHHSYYPVIYESKEDFIAKRVQVYIDRHQHLQGYIKSYAQDRERQLQDNIESKPKANPPDHNGCMKVTPDKLQTIFDLRSQGMTQQAIAEKVGVHRNTVNKSLHNAGDNITNTVQVEPTEKERGTSQGYLIGRLKRDYPEVIDKIGKGKEYPSVRSAAIATGIIKPKITVQFDPSDSGGEIISKLYQKLSDDQLKEMLENLLNYFGG